MGSIYFVRGHGTEELVDMSERPVMPKGYTLVTFSECGQVTYDKDVMSFTELFKNPKNRDVLANPDKTELSSLVDYETIHIYREGDKYPKLRSSFILEWPHLTDKSKYSMAKSGLYKFPISPDFDFSIRDTGLVMRGFYAAPKDEDEFKSLYEGAVYPTSDALDKAMSKDRREQLPTYHELNKFYLGRTIDQIFEIGGPGVYYWPVCRGLKEEVSTVRNYSNNIWEHYAYNLNKSNESTKNYLKQRHIEYFPHYHTWHKTYNKVSDMMDENQSNKKIPNPLKNILKRRRNKINTTYKQISKIRRNSLNAQNRRTRRRRRV
jgi:hypothetical protein